MTIKDSTSRILLALASADVTRGELRGFLHWIDSTGLEQTADIIETLRDAATDTTRAYGRSLFVEDTRQAERSISERHLVSRIEKIMLESGLTKSATIQATNTLLKQRGYSLKTLPDSNKIAFRSWIEKLVRRVPAEELLSVASLVRGKSVQGIDWPLRREKP